MNNNNNELLFKEEVFQIVGCAMEILNSLGSGFLEKPYENALVVEFEIENIPYKQQERFPIIYKNVQIGEYIPDLIVFNNIIVDTKVIDKIGDTERGQMINYLKVTSLRVGLLLNFRYSKLQWERIIL